MLKILLMCLVALLISGCASYGVIENKPFVNDGSKTTYGIKAFSKKLTGIDNALLLSFSGGGTRAAALAYGVMQELQATNVEFNGTSDNLLNEVDFISSVSGGSFTAAYYGLHGDQIFDDFESVFLRRDIEGALKWGFFNPFRWFSTKGRTEMAVDYYEKHIFKGATFADMMEPGRPLISINASDLGYGVRFSFIQGYFNLLCSDLNSFPVARAVAASSAVPIVFNPVVVENYDICKSSGVPGWLEVTELRGKTDPHLALLAKGLSTYYDTDQRKYVHFVDGGITDNLGLRAISDVIEIVGSLTLLEAETNTPPPRRIIIVSVNASTDPHPTMDLSNKQPGIGEAISAMSNVQLHNYNVATTELLKSDMKRWALSISTPERPVQAYFIELKLSELPDPADQNFVNSVPTSFTLTDEQVDKMIWAGRALLRNNPDFKRLLEKIAANDP